MNGQDKGRLSLSMNAAWPWQTNVQASCWFDFHQTEKSIGSPAEAALHPVVRAALFHQQFTAIHPFRDGNGRTARALVILLLWQSGFPTEILALQRVLDERRDAYVAALRAADQGNIQEWVRFFVNAVVDALQTEMQLI